MMAWSAVATLLAIVAPAPGPTDGPAELQGAWRLVSVEADGVAEPLDARPRWTIRGEVVRYGGEDLAAIVADGGSSPRSIDLKFAGQGRVLEGIYAVDKGTLRVCLNRRSDGIKERPHAFSTKGKADWRLLTFRRVDADTDDGDEAEADGLRGFVGLLLRFDMGRGECLIDDTLDDSPARKAGLRKGDVLLGVAGESPRDLRSAVGLIRRARPGSDLALRVRRDRAGLDVKVRAAFQPFAVVAGLE